MWIIKLILRLCGRLLLSDKVWSIFRSNHCLFGNSHKILFAPHPFSFLTSFIAALSSPVNGIVCVYV